MGIRMRALAKLSYHTQSISGLCLHLTQAWLQSKPILRQRECRVEINFFSLVGMVDHLYRQTHHER